MAVATRKKITPAQRDALIDELLADRAADQYEEIAARSPREQHVELQIADRRAAKTRARIAKVQEHIDQVNHQRGLKVRRGAHVDEVSVLDDARLAGESELDRLRAELRDLEALQAALAPGEAAFEAEKAEQAKGHAAARLAAAQERAEAAAVAVEKAHEGLASAVRSHLWDGIRGERGFAARYGQAVARQMCAVAYLADVEREVKR